MYEATQFTRGLKLMAFAAMRLASSIESFNLHGEEVSMLATRPDTYVSRRRLKSWNARRFYPTNVCYVAQRDEFMVFACTGLVCTHDQRVSIPVTVMTELVALTAKQRLIQLTVYWALTAFTRCPSFSYIPPRNVVLEPPFFPPPQSALIERFSLAGMVQARFCFPSGLILWSSMANAQRPTYTATYAPQDTPYHTEQGQSGYNQCGTGYNQTSECQNAYVNTLQDFCIWAPPEGGPDSVIEQTKQIEVAWCMKSGYGTRLIPDGTITGAHFVVTPDYVQVTGVGNLSNINIPPGDAGGELDPHGTTGEGNPIGALVFSSAFGSLEQVYQWTSFVSDEQFCFRACKPSPSAPTLCQHVYDDMGCEWSMPANYSEGTFETCLGDSAEPIGIFGTSTFYQGQPMTPPPPSAPPSSSCTTYKTISNGQGVLPGGITSPISKPVSTIVRSHYHSQKNTHHRHFTFSATTITFPAFSSSPLPLSSPATLSPPDATSLASFSPSTNIGVSGIPSMSSHSNDPSSPTLNPQSTPSESTASFDPSTSLHSSMTPSWSSSALGPPLTSQFPLTSVPSSWTSQTSSISDPISSPSSTASTSPQTSFSTTANSQGQIGSQCPVNAQAVRMNRRNSSGAASFVVLENLVFTFFAIAVGSSFGVLIA